MNSAEFDGIVVIQCAASKQPGAGTFTQDGLPIEFVAHPELATKDETCIYAHPDDKSVTGESWRNTLIKYNDRYGESNENPLGLLQAWQLYTPRAPHSEIYRDLVRNYSAKKVYILSAGWGLLSAEFLTPFYDITFSSQAANLKRRMRHECYADFQQIDSSFEGTLAFFGGKDYLALLYNITRSLYCRKVVFYKSEKILRSSGYEYEYYETPARTNWHYEYSKAFIDGRIAI